MWKKIAVLASLISTSAMTQTWKDHFLVKNCEVYKLNGDKVKTYPGRLCQFFDDGSFVMASLRELKFLTSQGEVKWTISGEFHHQLNLSVDGKRLLVLSSKYQTDQKGEKLGIDHIMIVSKEGKVLHETLTDWMYKTLKDSQPWSKTELTHFNSFYEIPKITEKGVPAYIKEGNFIVNAYTMGIFILSSDLKTILHHQNFASSTGHKIHDVQILANGNYLYFNNIDSRSTDTNRFSSVQEMDHKGRIISEFPKERSPLFFSLHMGGVQSLDQDHWLISHAVLGSYIYSKKSQQIISNIYQTHYEYHRFLTAQQVKLKDLKLFLSVSGLEFLKN